MACAGTAWGNNTDYFFKATPLSIPPKIDGLLDERFWQSAAKLDSFTQYEPQEGGIPSEKTVVYIGYDTKNLYIGVKCYDSDPKAIRAPWTNRARKATQAHTANTQNHASPSEF